MEYVLGICSTNIVLVSKINVIINNGNQPANLVFPSDFKLNTRIHLVIKITEKLEVHVCFGINATKDIYIMIIKGNKS